MAEAINARRHVCAQCGAISEPKRGPPPIGDICRICKRNIRALAAHHARKAAKPGRKCADCGVDLGPRFKRCDACRINFAKAYQRTWYADNVRWDRPSGQCEVCSQAFVPHVPTQRVCSEVCRAKRKRRRPSEARGLYKYARWARIRSEQLASEPDCRFCAEVGKQTPATVCDHITPHRGNIEAFWAGPFQSLCAVCHSRDKQRIERSAA